MRIYTIPVFCRNSNGQSDCHNVTIESDVNLSGSELEEAAIRLAKEAGYIAPFIAYPPESQHKIAQLIPHLDNQPIRFMLTDHSRVKKQPLWGELKFIAGSLSLQLAGHGYNFRSRPQAPVCLLEHWEGSARLTALSGTSGPSLDLAIYNPELQAQ